MYRPGHYGMVLLLYSVVGYVLISRQYDDHALAGTVLVVLATMSPDWDGYVSWLPHRGPTHSIAFALLVGAVLGVSVALHSGWRGHETRTVAGLGIWAGGLGTLSVFAHLLADAITPVGVPLFYPLSTEHVTLDLVAASNPAANFALLAAGLLASGTCWRVASDRAVHEVPSVPVLLRRVYHYLLPPGTD